MTDNKKGLLYKRKQFIGTSKNLYKEGDIVKKKKLFELLRGNFNDQQAIEEIVGIGFMVFMEKKYNLDGQLNFADHEEFNDGALKLSDIIQKDNTQESGIIKDIIVSGIIRYCKEASEVYNELKNASYEELFDLITRSLYTPETLSLAGSMHLSSSDITDLVYVLTKDRNIKTIADICSGNGNFLVEVADKYPNSSLYGIETYYNSYLISRIRLCLINANYQLHEGNVLSTSFDRKYDLVFSNYPWNMKPTASLVEDVKPRIHFKEIKLRSDWAFIEKAVNSFANGGRAIVLVSEGCLYNGIDQEYRKALVENKLLEMVIALPAGTIAGTSVNYSVLMLSENNDKVQFIDATKFYKTEKRYKSLDIEMITDKIIQKGEGFIKVENETLLKEEEINLSAPHFFQSKIFLPFPKAIKEVAHTFRGYQFNPKKQIEEKPGLGQYSILKLGNINDGEIDYKTLNSFDDPSSRADKFILKDGDVVFTCRGIGYKTALIHDIGNNKVVPSSNLMVIRPDSEYLDPMYLNYFLNSSLGKECIKRLQTGGVIPSITKSSLDNMEIPVMDKDTQEVVVTRYQIINKKINEIREQLITLEQKSDNIIADLVGE